MARLMITVFPQPTWFLLIDDTFIYRSSKKAPGSAIHHQHGNKPNRYQYTRGQSWVTMALSISTGLKQSAVPMLSRLMRTSGNSTKLDAAKLLLRVIAPVFAGHTRVITFVDSWFMKWPYLECVVNLGLHTIGQVRYDTVLFGIPVLTGRRGRPKKKWVINIRRKLLLHCLKPESWSLSTASGNGFVIEVLFVLPDS